MTETSRFDLIKIIKESTVTLKEKFPDAQESLAQVATTDMQTPLTPRQALTIAQTILNKVGFKGDSNES